jgi:O-antigen/teichoic acid export membrane protein
MTARQIPLRQLAARLLPGSRAMRDYLTLASGSVGRLAISLAYFLVAANVLSLADFGFFATASAAGVVLARVAGFGFISPLFRAATTRQRVVGVHLGGYLAAFALSLPLVALLAFGLHRLAFGGMPGLAFALIIIAEVVAWRMLEAAAIVNNGLRRFGRASLLVLAGTGIRTIVALGFWLAGATSLTVWAWCYLGANMAAAALAWIAFTPAIRPRLNLRLTLGGARDALAAAAADIIFYVQAELDKAVVLMAAGPRAAGLYAIAMRVIDITAMPVRAYNQLAMQKAMTERGVAAGPLRLAGVEGAIALASSGALAGLAAVLWLWPDMLGRNIGSAAALFPLMLAVPALRNLIEYHAELLYGLERTGLRAAVLALGGAVKALGIWLAILLAQGELAWAAWVNLAFLGAYMLSAAATYRVVGQKG